MSMMDRSDQQYTTRIASLEALNRHLMDENDRLRAALADLLISADLEWEIKRMGHDWAESCEAARAILYKEGEAR